VQGAVHRVLGPIGVPPADPQAPADQVEADQAAPPQPEAPPAAAPTGTTADPSASPTAEATASSTPSPEAMALATPDVTASPETPPTGAPVPLPTGSAEPTSPAQSPTAAMGESPTGTLSETASPSPSADPTAGPSGSSTASPSADPSASPTSTLSTSPTASPSTYGAQTPPPPATAIIEAAVGHRVAPGQTTVFSGVVYAPDGSAVPNARVLLQQQTDSGWREVGAGTTSKDGTVSLTSAPADRTARYRFKVQDVRSAAWRLVLKPTLSASSSTSGGVATVSVAVAGGRPGSPVLLMTRRDGEQVVVTSTSLGADGQVRFSVPAPTAQSWYVVRIVPTGAHAGASARVLVAPGVSQPSVTPSP
jgi:hypothetical protein